MKPNDGNNLISPISLTAIFMIQCFMIVALCLDLSPARAQSNTIKESDQLLDDILKKGKRHSTKVRRHKPAIKTNTARRHKTTKKVVTQGTRKVTGQARYSGSGCIRLLVGKRWVWSIFAPVVFVRKGGGVHMIKAGKDTGTVTCTGPRSAELRWYSGWRDKITISANGRKLSGHNQIGFRMSATAQ